MRHLRIIFLIGCFLLASSLLFSSCESQRCLRIETDKPDDVNDLKLVSVVLRSSEETGLKVTSWGPESEEMTKIFELYGKAEGVKYIFWEPHTTEIGMLTFIFCGRDGNLETIWGVPFYMQGKTFISPGPPGSPPGSVVFSAELGELFWEYLPKRPESLFFKELAKMLEERNDPNMATRIKRIKNILRASGDPNDPNRIKHQ